MFESTRPTRIVKMDYSPPYFLLLIVTSPVRLTSINVLVTRALGAVGVGLSLDPEGRKRLLVWGSSFALKNRDRSFWTFSFLYFFP